MSCYILNSDIALRSWRLVPYAYYIKGVRDAKGLKKDEFEVRRKNGNNGKFSACGKIFEYGLYRSRKGR